MSTLVLRFIKDESGAVEIGGGLATAVVAVSLIAIVQVLSAKLNTFSICTQGALGYINAYRLAWDISGARSDQRSQQHERYYVSDPVSSAASYWEHSNAPSFFELAQRLFAIG